MTSRPADESRFNHQTKAQLVAIFEQRPELMKIALNELSYILKPRQSRDALPPSRSLPTTPRTSAPGSPSSLSSTKSHMG
jgi:hypothetical protein